MYVIGHHAPRKEFIAGALKTENRIRYNFGDALISHVARSEPAIKAAFRFFEQATQFACISGIGGSVHRWP